MDKVRMGFIGVGHRGSGQAVTVDRDFAQRAEIVALADVNSDNLGRSASRLTQLQPDTYADWRRVLERADVEAVCISTPQDTHKEITVAAFEAGKHVYCEKPLAITVADCNAMIAAGQQAGKVLLVGQQMRYSLHLYRMSQMIDQGVIGTPYMVWLNEFRNPFPSSMLWAFDKAKSGGALVEKSCHHFDFFTWMMRTRPVRVLASGGQAVHKEIYGAPSNIVDNASVIIEHEGGRRAMLNLCFFAGLPHSLEGGVGTHTREIGLIGDRAMITSEGFYTGRNLELRYADRADVVKISLDTSKGDRSSIYECPSSWGIWLDFFNCVRDGGRPAAPGEIGRDAVAVGLAAERAIETGQPVAVDQVS